MAELKPLDTATVDAFRRDGYVTLRGFVAPGDLAAIERIFEGLISGALLPTLGKDRGEHTPGLFNVTAFAQHAPFEALGEDGLALARLDARALAATRQLFGDSAAESVFARDYEQLLRKLPDRPTAVFPAHQDSHYWPRSGSGAFDMRTATFSLAVNAADAENGCLWVLPGSHVARGMYPGCISRKADSRPDGGGVIELAVLPADLERRVWLPLAPGDVTIHDEWLVHGSEGNAAPARTRDTLILAYRARSMIAFERALGFRHSYEDGEEVLRKVRDSLFP